MGKYHFTIDLLFDWFGISCMTTDNFCFYWQKRLIQTSQTGGQQYSDNSRFSIPWYWPQLIFLLVHEGEAGKQYVYQGTLTKGKGSVWLTSSLR
jgi:hypothetical protein